MLDLKSIKFKRGDLFRYTDGTIGRITFIRPQKNPITGKDSVVIFYKKLNNGSLPSSPRFFFIEGGLYVNSIKISKQQAFLELL
jgi:hypothetical protein